ncbi:MAG: hypothetical protein MK125_13810 [Dehalococcoidia bacterium]|nr:hypothetical protein [Dehalococcoidia bacterium]
MPICYRHIEDLAQSISRRGLTESVLVLAEPGLADPDRVSPNLFCCFLCQREGAGLRFKSPIGKSVDDKY